MTKEYIRNYFARHGYKVTECMSEAVIVKARQGSDRLFESLNQAYKFYKS